MNGAKLVIYNYIEIVFKSNHVLNSVNKDVGCSQFPDLTLLKWCIYMVAA